MQESDLESTDLTKVTVKSKSACPFCSVIAMRTSVSGVSMDAASEEFSKMLTWGPSQHQEPTSEPVASLSGATKSAGGSGA